MNQFLRFCAVGAHANPYAARIVSFLAAASGTWLMNRHYVFAVLHKPTHAEWLRYVGLMVLGALVNYGAYALCIAFLVFARAQPWLGVTVGSIAGLGVNFTTSRLLFRQAKRSNGLSLPT